MTHDSRLRTKIVAVGCAVLATCAVARAQSADSSFSAGANSWVVALAVQPDGKILVGGDFTTLGGGGTGTTARNHLGRLNADGSIDTSFDPGANGGVYTIALQPDGRILVGGAFTTLGGGGTGTTARNYLGRLNADGSLDTSFDPGANHQVYKVALQPDGKILVAGLFTTLGGGGTGTMTRNYLGRLNADGSLDSTFDPGASDWVEAVALQPDGKILVGGWFKMLGGGGTGTTTRNRIGRLYPDGSLDSSFDPGADGGVLALVVHRDGKIVVGGWFTALGGGAGTTTRNRIGRLNADGSVDTSFDPGANETVYALAEQADGKILVGGAFTTLGGGGLGATLRNFVGRLNADGTLDASFNPGANRFVLTAAEQADGQILVGGAFTTLGGGGLGAKPHNFIGRLRSGPEANPSSLRFGAVKAGAGTPITAQTSAQAVTVTFSGAPSSWTATTTQTWLSITGGSGSGAGTFAVAIQNPLDVIGAKTSLLGTVTITAATTSEAPLSIPVTLTIDQTGGVSSKPPIGLVDSPAQGATGQVGAIGVTGWVVDDIGVRSVKIYRDCLTFEPALNCVPVNGASLVYVGDATIVSGARPDIEAIYPTYPQSYRAAWGYLLLTNMLPHVPNELMFGGQGTLTLYVLAEDMEGHQRWLGRDFIAAPTETNQTPTTFTMANDTIAKPFGAIDTPAQGETVTGGFLNFGWTLTPDSNTTAEAGDILMPLNGSTQFVYVDGVLIGPVGAYNLCRGTVSSPPLASEYCDDDVSSIFGNPTPQPTYSLRTSNPTKHRNLDAGRGPIAAYWLDTAALSNGVHTIVWGVSDTAGRSEGIGSRYFTVLNGSADAAVASRGVAAMAADAPLRDAPAFARGDAHALDTLTPATGRVWGRTSFDLYAQYSEVAADDTGVRHVQICALGRLELWLGAVERGYLVANGTLRDLPPGSHLDIETGVFTWSPGLGYFGTYRLAFPRGGEHVAVEVTIRPIPQAAAGENQIRMSIDVPRSGAAVSGAITVAGWALDPQAWAGSGVDAVHVWAQRVDLAAAAPQFLGAAALAGARPDVAQVYGPTFGTAGFSLTTDALAPGQYDITVFAWSRRTARWEDARTVTVTIH